MNQTAKYFILMRRQNLLYAFIFVVGLFLHLLLWDADFLNRLSRMSQGWSGISAVFSVIWDWLNIYLIQGIGIWLFITALMMLFIVLPMLTRYGYIRVRATPWLAINVSVYLFLIFKMLRVY